LALLTSGYASLIHYSLCYLFSLELLIFLADRLQQGVGAGVFLNNMLSWKARTSRHHPQLAATSLDHLPVALLVPRCRLQDELINLFSAFGNDTVAELSDLQISLKPRRQPKADFPRSCISRLRSLFKAHKSTLSAIFD